MTETNTATSEWLLQVEGLTVGYRGRALLPPATLSVASGQFWAIVGPNGSGKTTFLRSLLGLMPALSGSVSWESQTVGYVPQRNSIDAGIPARVIDVVRDGLEGGWSFLHPLHRMQRRDCVQEAMRDANVSHLGSQQITELSEGQKQRVLMARALASRPEILILDEPTSAMDVQAERSIFDLIENLRSSRKLAVLLVSHHLGVVAQHATHLLMVDKDHGMLLSGTLEEVAVHKECLARYGSLFQHVVGAP